MPPNLPHMPPNLPHLPPNLPHMPPNLPHMSPNLPHMPPATRSLPCMCPCDACDHAVHAPCHACHPAIHTPTMHAPPPCTPSPCEQTDTCENITFANSFAGGKYISHSWICQCLNPSIAITIINLQMLLPVGEVHDPEV